MNGQRLKTWHYLLVTLVFSSNSNYFNDYYVTLFENVKSTGCLPILVLLPQSHKYVPVKIRPRGINISEQIPLLDKDIF